jgi:hypothetical protein
MNKYNPETFGSLFNTDLGQRLWAFLNEHDTILRMETASDLGKPAVEAIEESMIERFRDEVDQVTADRCKQMIGHMTRQVMAARGYAIAQQNVKVDAAVFSRATRYGKAGAVTFHAHRGGGHTVALTLDRAGAHLPGDRKWTYWKTFESGIRARVVFGIADEAAVAAEINKSGFYVYEMPRLLQAGAK